MTRDLAKTIVTTLAALSLLCVVTAWIAGDNIPGLVAGAVLYATAGLIAFRCDPFGRSDGSVECSECGRPFEPADSPSDEACWECAEFLDRYYGRTPDEEAT